MQGFAYVIKKRMAAHSAEAEAVGTILDTMKEKTFACAGKYRPLPKGAPAKSKNKRHPRRSLKHDYRAKKVYFITSVVNPDIDFMPLCCMPPVTIHQLKNKEIINPILSPIGQMIEKEILDISYYHPEIKIIRYVIMPDHIHIVLKVIERLKRHLGNELAGFFGACSKHYESLLGKTHTGQLFDPFFDRIIRDSEQFDKAVRYVEDNPRRFILKKRNPQLFKKHLNLRIEGRIYAAFGNMFLLRYISLLPVRIHRRWSEQEFENYEKECIEKIENGAIPISPAIHKAEKKILNIAIDMGSSVIKLTAKGFGDRFKPQGKDFDLCAEGRLLLLSPWPDDISGKSTAGYTEFHDMNDYALAISEMPSTSRMAIMESSSVLSLVDN